MNWKVGLLTCFGLAVPLQGSGDDATSPSTTRVEIKDSKYQSTAYAMEIPAGWKFAGDIVHTQECHSTGSALRFTILDPNSIGALAFLPFATWNWTSTSAATGLPGCASIDIDSAASFLLNIAIPSLRPQAKVMEVLPLLPEVQAFLKVQLAEQQKQVADAAKKYGGPLPTVTLDGARVRIQYDRHGQPVEEMINSVVECTQNTMSVGKNTAPIRRRTCSSAGVGITRAPQGHLDELLARYKDLYKTLQVKSDWQSRSQTDDLAALQRPPDPGELPPDTSESEFLRALKARETDDSPLYPEEFRNPDTGQVIRTSRKYNRQWHAHEGTEYTETWSPMNDRRLVRVPFSQIWAELVVK